MKSIAIIATLDTKGTEALFLKRLIKKAGYRPILIDVSCRLHSFSRAEIPNHELAKAGGFKISKESGKRDIADKMSYTVAKLVLELYKQNKLHGVIGIGGSIGAGIASSSMKSLPFGVPKLCVTTIQNTAPIVGWKDIAVLYPVTDLSDGEYLNRFEQVLLSNAAGAMIGMVESSKPKIKEGKPLILASMFGSTTPCVTHAKKILEKHGYEVVVFHAQGSGGRAIEEFVSTENVSGVLDITTHELVDDLAGGALSAGQTRLEAAGRAGIPQLICPGALDIIVFFGFSTIPKRYAGRRFYQHSQHVVNMRASVKEMLNLAKIMAEKLNKAKGPTTIAIPLKGWSEYDIEGGVNCVDIKGNPLKKPWYDPTANEAFIKTLNKRLDKSNLNINLIYVDAHINEPSFASTVAEEMMKIVNAKSFG